MVYSLLDSSTRSNLNNYTLRVMPYDEDLREGFIDFKKPSAIPILLLVAAISLFLLYI